MVLPRRLALAGRWLCACAALRPKRYGRAPQDAAAHRTGPHRRAFVNPTAGYNAAHEPASLCASRQSRSVAARARRGISRRAARDVARSTGSGRGAYRAGRQAAARGACRFSQSGIDCLAVGRRRRAPRRSGAAPARATDPPDRPAADQSDDRVGVAACALRAPAGPALSAAAGAHRVAPARTAFRCGAHRRHTRFRRARPCVRGSAVAAGLSRARLEPLYAQSPARRMRARRSRPRAGPGADGHSGQPAARYRRYARAARCRATGAAARGRDGDQRRPGRGDRRRGIACGARCGTDRVGHPRCVPDRTAARPTIRTGVTSASGCIRTWRPTPTRAPHRGWSPIRYGVFAPESGCRSESISIAAISADRLFPTGRDCFRIPPRYVHHRTVITTNQGGDHVCQTLAANGRAVPDRRHPDGTLYGDNPKFHSQKTCTPM